MPRRREGSDTLVTTRWVHLFEEDTAQGAVYRPDSADVPLSRRPREQIELSRDGSARIFVPAPDDRLSEIAATWADENGVVVVRARGPRGGVVRELRIVEVSPDRLLVRG